MAALEQAAVFFFRSPYFLPANTPEQAVSLILKVVGERIPARFGLDPIAQVQVLFPMARGG